MFSASITRIACTERFISPVVTFGSALYPFRRHDDTSFKKIPLSRQQNRHLFWESDKKSGYNKEAREQISNLEHAKIGFKMMKGEILLWKNEIKEKLTVDPFIFYREGVIDEIWNFKDPKAIHQFISTSDSDQNEGYSKCSFEPSKAGRALFTGYLDTTPPKDGKVKRAGYCNIRSMRKMKSFQRDSYFDWTLYNTLVLKVRGDGRPYLINLSCQGYWDITWNDIYHYVLYTRGGPYWQTAKIPFSKFLLGSHGRVQDKQARVRLDRISHFGISCGEKIKGNFSLEIEYVGLELDPEHDEDFAYEMYKTDRNIAGT